MRNYLFQKAGRSVSVDDSFGFLILAGFDGFCVALDGFVNLSCLEVLVAFVF